jgi:hypothetical protein
MHVLRDPGLPTCYLQIILSVLPHALRAVRVVCVCVCVQLKKDYLEGVGDTFDVVPIGGFYGRGKRTGECLLPCFLSRRANRRPSWAWQAHW